MQPTGIIPTYTIKSCHSLRPNLRFCNCLSFLASKISVEGSFILSSLECPRRLRLCGADKFGRASGFGGGWREGKMMDSGERTWKVIMKNRAEYQRPRHFLSVVIFFYRAGNITYRVRTTPQRAHLKRQSTRSCPPTSHQCRLYRLRPPTSRRQPSVQSYNGRRYPHSSL